MVDLRRWSGTIVLSRNIGQSRTYTVGWPFSYTSKAGQTFKLVTGFSTDGASVPRIAWSYMSPFAGVHVPAVILHDALYSTHFEDRKSCDKLLREALESLGMRKSKAWLVYQSVRLGGSWAWKNHEPPLPLGEVLEVSDKRDNEG